MRHTEISQNGASNRGEVATADKPLAAVADAVARLRYGAVHLTSTRGGWSSSTSPSASGSPEPSRPELT